MEDELIYTENKEEKSPIIYNFQLIEFILIGIYFLLFLKGLSTPFSGKIASISTLLFFIILLYPFVRIFFEYKRQLITRPGIALKLFLYMLASVIFMGMLMKMVEHPLANVTSTGALFSMAFSYPFYVLVLEKITFKTKIILAINAICVAALAMGVLMAVLKHPLTYNVLLIGMIMTCLSLVSFIIINKGITKKGKYHSVNYFARSLLFVILGLNYMI